MRFRFVSTYQAIGLSFVFVCLAVAAGCSGGGSPGSALPNPVIPPPQQQPQESQEPLSGSSSAISLKGRVDVVLSSTKFNYATGSPHGHVPVLYSESMVDPADASIKIDQSVTVRGTFNSRGELVATKVTVDSATPAPTPTPHHSPTPTPTRTSTPGPTGRYHIATWAYDNNNGQGDGASAASVNQYLSYAQGNWKSVNDCHSGSHSCKAVFYLDYSQPYSNSPSSCVYHPDADVVAAASESWYLHDSGHADSSHRVHGKSRSGCLILQMNPNSSGAQSWWRNYLQANANSYDLFFLDDDAMNLVDATYFSSGGGCDPWPSYCHSTQEIPNDADFASARANFVKAMKYRDGSPMYFISQGGIQPVLSLTDRFSGESCEGCVATGVSSVRPTEYANVLDGMATMNGTPSAYLLISHGNSPAGSAGQILQRLVTTGIVWLGYSEGHTIVQPDLEDNSKNLAVWPEDLIYPSGPIQSAIGTTAALQVTSGIWRREFRSCYQTGHLFGRCAAIVNSTGATVAVKSSWLSQTYKHTIKLSGGDVLSNGSVSVNSSTFVVNSTTVPAGGALLIAE